jgi:hypothetical protein
MKPSAPLSYVTPALRIIFQSLGIFLYFYRKMGFPVGARVAVAGVGIPVALYLTLLTLGATPFFQRQ